MVRQICQTLLLYGIYVLHILGKTTDQFSLTVGSFGCHQIKSYIAETLVLIMYSCWVYCKNWSMIFISNCHWNHTKFTFGMIPVAVWYEYHTSVCSAWCSVYPIGQCNIMYEFKSWLKFDSNFITFHASGFIIVHTFKDVAQCVRKVWFLMY